MPADSLAQSVDVWLATARPGAKLVYHIGELARDMISRPGLYAAARRFNWAQEQGLVELTQLRASQLSDTKVESPSTFYLATRTGVKE